MATVKLERCSSVQRRAVSQTHQEVWDVHQGRGVRGHDPPINFLIFRSILETRFPAFYGNFDQFSIIITENCLRLAGFELERKSRIAIFFVKFQSVTCYVGQFVDRVAIPNPSVLLFNVPYCFIAERISSYNYMYVQLMV